MDESVDSNPVLIVPSSVEDGDTNAVGADNPLGLPLKSLGSASMSSVQPQSFSCFQLSGIGEDSQSDSSQSLHIDEKENDIIPSSPGIMHIDIAATPSTHTTSCSSITVTSRDSCASGDMDSGRISPDLIELSEAASPNSEPLLSPSLEKHTDTVEDVPSSSNKNIFDAETIPYSQSDLPDPEKNEGPESFSFILRKAADKEDDSTPVIVSACTDGGDSEKRDLSADVASTSFNEAELNQEQKAELDLDSDVIIKDVSMRGGEDEAPNSPKAILRSVESDDVVASGTGMESQAYTQEDLHLHLTFESQLFDGSGLPNDSDALVIEEPGPPKQPVYPKQATVISDTSSTGNVTENRDCRPTSEEEVCASKTTHTEITTIEECSQEPENLESNSVNKCSGGNEPVNSSSIVESDESRNIPLPCGGQNDQAKSPEGSNKNEEVILSMIINTSQAEESQSLLDNVPSSHAPLLPQDGAVQSKLIAEESQSLLDDVPSSHALLSPQDGVVQPKLIAEESQSLLDDVPSSHAPLSPQDGAVQPNLIAEESQSLDGVPSSHAPLLPQDGAAQSKPIAEESQSLFDNTPHSQTATVFSQDGSLDSKLSEAYVVVTRLPDVTMLNKKDNDTPGPLPSESDKTEVSPLLQSTFVDDNNNKESLTASGSRQESLESAVSSQPASCNYDASLENSSLDHSEEFVDCHISDMDTQPFPLSAINDSTMEDLQEHNDDNDKQKEVLEINNHIRSIVDNIVEAVIVKSDCGKKDSGCKKTDQVFEEHSKTVEKVTGSAGEQQASSTKAFEFRSQSQPSKDICLRAQFRAPTTLSVREQSGGRGLRRRSSNKKSNLMEKDCNDNDITKENQNSEEHDKSSDTLPLDEGSGHDSDPLASPNKGRLEYRITKTILVETLMNGEVVNTRTVYKRPKIVTSPPYTTQHSSNSSNGSGYLADTSSLSRTSSDTSTQTNLSRSPGRPRRISEPMLRSEHSGSSNSSSGSSTLFAVPCHPPKLPKIMKSPEVPMITTSTSPISPQRSLNSLRVVLTPLSPELINPSGVKFSGDVATPPQCIINPPLSGSTPVETPEKIESSTSDITSSNSPEIGYPADSLQGASFPFDDSGCRELNKSAEKKNDTSEEITENLSRITFGEGIPVMAKLPTEPYFYPGMVRAQDTKSGKYTVMFEDDGKERQIRESDVLLIDKLNIGQEVYVQSDSDDPADWYSAGTIISFWREDEERGYVIEKSDTTNNMKTSRKYSRKHIIVKQDCLTKDQKLSRVQPTVGIAVTDVSLDNIVDGKRRTRRSNLGTPTSNSPASSRRGTPSPSSSSKTPKSSRKRRVNDSQSSSSSGSSSYVPFPSTTKSKRAKLTYGGSRTPAKKGRKSAKIDPAPIYKESKIFENCAFLLTSTTGQDQPSSEFDSPPCQTHSYNREITRKKIIAGGGQVEKTFTQLMSCDSKNLYVISDSFCRTVNYFNALAADIACLSYMWIDDSTDLGKLQSKSKYTLPAGYSLQFMEVVERVKEPVHPLNGLRVNLQMKDAEKWRPLLCLAGCDTVSTRQDKNKNECPLSCDVVVADFSCCGDLMERALSLKIPVVTIEWVIQCLIMGQKLSYDGHPQYKTFTQKDSNTAG